VREQLKKFSGIQRITAGLDARRSKAQQRQEESYQKKLRDKYHRRRDAFFEEHRAEFRQLYPGEHIAVWNGEVVAHSANLKQFREDIQRQGIEEKAWRTFIRTRPLVLTTQAQS
jgi:hypothetical protein